MIGLEHVLTYRFSIRGPLCTDTDGSPLGTREYWEMSEGTLTGSGVNATIGMPGGDWTRVSPDGFGRPDVRVQLETDDGALILMRYTGLVERTDAFIRAATNDEPTEWEDQYMRFAFSFDTGAEEYRWLTQACSSLAATCSGPRNSSMRFTGSREPRVARGGARRCDVPRRCARTPHNPVF